MESPDDGALVYIVQVSVLDISQCVRVRRSNTYQHLILVAELGQYPVKYPVLHAIDVNLHIPPVLVHLLSWSGTLFDLSQPS